MEDEIFKQNKIRHILVGHEQGGVHAAEGYARSTGKTGVVLATSGPNRALSLPRVNSRGSKEAQECPERSVAHLGAVFGDVDFLENLRE